MVHKGMAHKGKAATSAPVTLSFRLSSTEAEATSINQASPPARDGTPMPSKSSNKGLLRLAQPKALTTKVRTPTAIPRLNFGVMICLHKNCAPDHELYSQKISRKFYEARAIIGYSFNSSNQGCQSQSTQYAIIFVKSPAVL
jgi:hypothetical protein